MKLSRFEYDTVTILMLLGLPWMVWLFIKFLIYVFKRGGHEDEKGNSI